MSNIEVKSGDTININTNTQVASSTIKVEQGFTSVSIKGVQGGDAHFTHTQSTPSTVWSVQHNLGKKASVTVVDSADSVVYGDIEYTDLNNLTITFNGAFSGKAYFN